MPIKNESKKMIISIIMPVYNSDKYLRNAINSVLNQKYKEFELLLIDDGSTDESGIICDEYKLNDKRVKVYHKNNEGVSCARNFGIIKATGDYITFIDNDDLYSPDFLAVMVKEINGTNADIIKCGRKNTAVDEDGTIIRSRVSVWKDSQTFYNEQFLTSYYALKAKGLLDAVWNSLYRKSFLVDHELLFNENFKRGNEDVNFNICCYIKCKSIIIVKEVLYEHFYRNAHSTSLKYHEDQIITRLETVHLEESFIEPLKDTKWYTLIVLENIRVCFKLLTIFPKGKSREKALKLLVFSGLLDNLKGCNLMKYRELSIAKKFELTLIKKRKYSLYFNLYKTRLLILNVRQNILLKFVVEICLK